MPYAAPDDTQEQIDSLHHGIVVELHRRLSDGEDGSGAPSRPRQGHAGSLPPCDGASLSRSIERALRKVTSMQAFIRSHEETIHDLRQASAAREERNLESHRLLEDSERRCREEAKRAGRAERLIELLEQRNTQLEKDYTDLSRSVDELLRAINAA